jgi:NADH:ubiquinone reductase (non-electrogenic)
MLVRQRIAAASAAASPSAMQLSHLSRRSVLSSSTPTAAPSPSRSISLSTFSRRQQQQQVLAQRSAFSTSSRRSNASESTPPPPSPPKKKRAGFFRWTYRLTVFSALGLAGYLTYSIYHLRHPEEQLEPDPSKKTLVILGLFPPIYLSTSIYVSANNGQEVDGAPSRCSRNSTPKTTMSS